jgi:hypothetical protein
MNDIIAQIIVDTKAYSDLADPVILASGVLGIYYINTENVLQDNGKWKEFGYSAKDMVEHACDVSYDSTPFCEVIQILAEEAHQVLNSGCLWVISGGQRRDWLFSGPLADELGLPHVSLYKQDGPQEGRVEVIRDGLTTIIDPGELAGYRAIHVVDLITHGSSIYDNGRGWVPMLRSQGVGVDDVMAVVSRGQGGEARLSEQGVTVRSQVGIDTTFLQKYSTNPNRALAYFHSPEEWSNEYLKEHGALAFLDNFNPEGSKLSRARKFLRNYQEVLQETGRIMELADAVQSSYGAPMHEIMEEQ